MNQIQHRTTRRIVAGLVAAAALAVPGQASATTAGMFGGALTIASGSEATDLTVTQVADTLVVADATQSLNAGWACTSHGTPAQVVCPAGPVTSIFALLGDGNDSLDFSTIAVPAKVYGGPGNDRIVTGGGADTADGGSGNDVFATRDGNADEVACGSGDDSGQVDADDSLTADCESAVERSAAGTADPAGSVPPTDGGDGTSEDDPEDPATDEPDAAPVRITTLSAIVLSPRGDFRIGIACGADNGSCRGTIELIEVGGTIKARSVVNSARRRKLAKRGVVLGRGKFAVRAGADKNVTVRLDRRGRQRIIRKKNKTKAKLVITTRSPDGTKATTTKNVTIAAPRERRTSSRSRGGRTKAAR